jgi:hypothetical protein
MLKTVKAASSLNIITMMKSRAMRQRGHVARMAQNFIQNTGKETHHKED